jgi:hypothetical protein
MLFRDLYEYASTVKAAYNETTRKQPFLLPHHFRKVLLDAGT